MLNYDAVIDRYGVSCDTFLDFGKIQDCLIVLIHMVGFNGILDIGKKGVFMTMKYKLVDEIDKRFTVKLVKMIKNAVGKYNHYSSFPKRRHILLHWSYESTEKDML